MFYGAPPEIFRRAKTLRNRLTPAERKLWLHLCKNQLAGYKFRRQHPIKYWIVDFYCHAAKLVLELDGSIHNIPEQRAYDARRTEHLESLGLRVIRFDNEMVYYSIEEVLEEVRRVLKEGPPHPPAP